MARAFNVDSARSTFELPELTRKQIQALILDLDMDARGVVITAIAQLWQREIGEPDRDFGAEIDDLRARLDALAGSEVMEEVMEVEETLFATGGDGKPMTETQARAAGHTPGIYLERNFELGLVERVVRWWLPYHRTTRAGKTTWYFQREESI